MVQPILSPQWFLIRIPIKVGVVFLKALFRLKAEKVIATVAKHDLNLRLVFGERMTFITAIL